MNDRVDLLLVDDQVLFLESLKIVIENLDKSIKVVGLATNGQEAIDFLAGHSVDIVLMDVRMPVMDGVTASRIIHDLYPDLHIIMLTTFDDDAYVLEAMKNGASGYLLKNIAPTMLVSALRAVKDGSILMDPNIAGSLVQQFLSGKKESKKITGETLPDWFFTLTPKEKQIIKYVLSGKNNKEIASDCNLGEQTVRNYISTIYSKLEVADRRSLIQKAREISPSFFS